MVVYNTEGIVLRTRNMGEADKVVTFYTKDHGKVTATARGVRRPRNRLLGPTQVFTHGRYMLFKGRQLDTLSQGEIIYSHQKLREDLDDMAAAMYLTEVMDLFLEEGEPNPDLFQLLVTVLDLGTDKRFDFALRVFELRLMALLGYEPQLQECIGCGLELGEPAFFSPEGGVVCNGCRTQFTKARSITKGTREWMQRFLQWDLERVAILHPSRSVLDEIQTIMAAYIAFRLDRPLKSLGFLQSLRTDSDPSDGQPRI